MSIGILDIDSYNAQNDATKNVMSQKVFYWLDIRTNPICFNENPLYFNIPWQCPEIAGLKHSLFLWSESTVSIYTKTSSLDLPTWFLDNKPFYKNEIV